MTSILCFTWNASGLLICESASKEFVEERRAGVLGLFRKPCETPDFFEVIRQKIRDDVPDIVVISTQGELSGSDFHEKFLPTTLKEIDYKLLKRQSLDNIGDKNNEFLAISIFTRFEYLDNQLKTLERKLAGQFGSNGQLTLRCDYDNRKAGAIASFTHTSEGKLIAFVAVNLPKGNYDLGDSMYPPEVIREATVTANNLCFIKFMGRFFYNLKDEWKPQAIILLGDMNYNITPPSGYVDKKANFYAYLSGVRDSNEIRNKIYPLDEFYAAKDKSQVLGMFKEGIDGYGPLFLPDWRYIKNRKTACYDLSTLSGNCFDVSSAPDEYELAGWHERILYMSQSGTNVTCSEYASLDGKNLKKSDTLGVVGSLLVE